METTESVSLNYITKDCKKKSLKMTLKNEDDQQHFNVMIWENNTGRGQKSLIEMFKLFFSEAIEITSVDYHTFENKNLNLTNNG